GVLPAALPWPLRDAAALRRLSRRIRRLEPGVVDRLLYLRLRRPDLPLRPDRCVHAQAAGCGQSVGPGRHHAGMDAALAAAVPPVRGTAARAVINPRRLD